MKTKETKGRPVKEKKIKTPRVPKMPKLPKEKIVKKKQKFMPFAIRNKIIVSFLIPIVFMVIVGTTAYQKAQTGLSGNYISSTSQTVIMASEYIDQGCAYVNSEAIKYASDPDLSQMFLGLYKNEPITALNINTTVKNNMNSAQLANDFIFGIHIIPKSSFNVMSSKAAGGTTGFLTEYLEDMGMDKKTIVKWTDHHDLLDTKLNEKSSDYILVNQMLSGAGTYAVVIDIQAKAIRKFLSSLDFGEGSIVALVTENGRELICDTDFDLGLEEGEKVFFDKSFFEIVADNTERDGAELVKYNGKNYYFIHSKSSVTEAAVCALVPENTVIEQANDIKNITMGLVIVAIIAALLIGLYIVMGIQKNMHKISDKLEEVAEGDLTVDVVARGHDEFRNLAGSANNMVKNTKKLVNKVSNATEELAVSAGQVSEVSDVIDECSKSINDAIAEISDGMEMQSKHAQECVEKTNTLSDEIQSISTQVEQVENMVDATENMIAEGMNIVRLLGNRAEETTEMTKQVGESIDTLRRDSEIINTFVSTISDIAEQTNLLSLNASIEAARAGEAGRGFAVVAEEIRKLADDSAQAAGEIGRNVGNISAQTLRSVESAKQAQEMVSLQTQAVEEAVEVFRRMQDQMSGLVSGLKEIVAGIERADAERGETVSSVKNISDIIEETTGTAEAVHIIADKLLKNVEELNVTADALNDNMDGLKTEISVFKI